MDKIANFFKDIIWTIKKDRKAQIITAVIAVLVIGLIALIVVAATNPQTPQNGNKNKNNKKNTSNSEETTRRIDGVQVDPKVANILPQVVIVENLASIRPQSGMSQANLIYEALAEGGITRFMLVYANNETIDLLGPVRSARLYYVDLAEEYGGAFFHIGGSPAALGALNTDEFMKDVNQFTYSQYYYRDENIPAPHNLFTNSKLLSYAMRDLSLSDKEGEYESYEFKKDLKKDERPDEVADLMIDFSSDEYKVEWKYDLDINSYLRSNGGQPHTDANNEKQLTAKNIVVQRVETKLAEADTGRLDMVTIGEGEAVLFQDGEAKKGTWAKKEEGDRTKFYDESGQEFEFNPGTTWIELVPIDNEVTY